MQKNALLIVIVLAVVVIGGFYLFRQGSSSYSNPSGSGSNMTSSPQASTPPSKSATPSPTAQTSGTTNSPSGATQSFTVNGDDSSADLTTINVKKGMPVSITFNVKANTVYHGGLDFRSSQISTGTIAPGSSKTINFTATNSFTFTPYWPATNTAKPYTISVVIQ